MRISAIVPVYNRSRYLRVCIDSLLGQTQPFDEIIVVNDASTEASVAQILESYAHHENLKIITNAKNAGISACQNTGWQSARSDFVAFVDCDDYLEPNAVEIVKANTRSRRFDYIFTDRTNLIEDSGERIRYRSARYYTRATLSDNLFDNMFASHLKVLSRAGIASTGGFRSWTDGAQDWDMALRMSAAGLTFHHIELPLYNHRIHRGQTSERARSDIYRRMNRIRREGLERAGLIAQIDRRSLHKATVVANRLNARLRYANDLYDRKSYLLPSEPLIFLFTSGDMKVYTLDEFIRPNDTDAVMVALVNGWGDLGRMRRIPQLSLIPKVLMLTGDQRAIACGQWFNSYFDVFSFLDETSQVGLQGYKWSDGLKQTH